MVESSTTSGILFNGCAVFQGTPKIVAFPLGFHFTDPTSNPASAMIFSASSPRLREASKSMLIWKQQRLFSSPRTKDAAICFLTKGIKDS